MPKSKKAKSTGSLSTTQETGKLYELTFSEGFTLQNNKSILHGDWMTAYEGIKFYRKNGDPHGDIDFLCRTTEELKVKDLFPGGLHISNPEQIIPASTDLYFEVTSMSGEDALHFSKVDRKKEFYSSIMNSDTRNDLRIVGLPVDVDLDSPSNIVFFVFNGMDFTDVKHKFSSDVFTGICVHLPMRMCTTWAADTRAKMEATRAEMEATRAEMEAPRANALLELLRMNGIPVPEELLKRQCDDYADSNSASTDVDDKR